MKKIKVLIEGMTSIVGGRETYIMTQYECIDTSLFQFDFVYDLPKGDFPERYIMNSRGSNVFYLRTRQEWKKFLQTHTDYDFLIMNLMGTGSIYYYRELKKYSNFKKIILHSHVARSYPFVGLDRIGQRKELKSLRKRFDGLNIARWACSDIAGKWMFGEDSDFEVIKNGIYPEKFAFREDWRKEIRDSLGIADSDFLIGNVGRIDFSKNQEFLIDVLAAAKKLVPSVKLIIVGLAQQQKLFQKLKDKIEEYGLGDSIVLTGPRNDVEKFYSAFDLFAFPSIFEGLGIVGIEAQTAGLPCLFSDTLTKELDIRKKECRFLPITPEAVSEWASAISDIHNDEKIADMRKSPESADIIRNAGYDVRLETERVCSLLENYLKYTKKAGGPKWT